MIPLSTALYDQMRALIRQGVPKTRIAQHLGVSRHSVHRALTSLSPRHRGAMQTPLDAASDTALSLPTWPSPSATKPSLTNT